jgi:dTDP-4-dehydrorhamnose 3,5-epimerase-like enzyme
MNVKLIPLESHLSERRGNITVMENLPFKIKRVFFIYSVPLDEMRGGHAHKKCHQLLVAACGAVLVKMGDGKDYILDCPDMGLYVPPMNIINLVFLTENTTLLVLASELYDREDYVWNT